MCLFYVLISLYIIQRNVDGGNPDTVGNPSSINELEKEVVGFTTMKTNTYQDTMLYSDLRLDFSAPLTAMQ